MPKEKTHKGLAKRVKLTKNGKIMRHRAGGSHLMSGWPSKVRRRLRRPMQITPADEDNIRQMMGNPKYFRNR